MSMYIFQILTTLWLVPSSPATLPTDNSTCKPTDDPCEIWLVVNERLTMFNDTEQYMEDNGKEVRYHGPSWPSTNEADDGMTKTKYPEILVDGWEKSVIVANHSLPGPAIIAYKNQNMVIHVTNQLISEAVTIHFHGQHQRGTGYADGVAYITQCPILPGQTFTQKFKAYPSGTFFYHSHIGGQRVDGLFGAFIVKEHEKEAKKQEAGGTGVEDEFIMHVSDWYHQRSSEIYTRVTFSQFAPKNQVYGRDGTKLEGFGWHSGHIEGRGQYYDSVKKLWTKVPNTVYTVTKGKKYRFRVIGSGLDLPLRISVDNHLLQLVASDGYDVEPYEVESFIINPGERFDFIITADQDIENYWIQAAGFMEWDHPTAADNTKYVRAILRYNGAEEEDPDINVSKHINCTTQTGDVGQCLIANCASVLKGYDSKCFTVDNLKMSEYELDREEVPDFDKDNAGHKEVFLNWVTGGEHSPYKVVNGNYFLNPPVSSLTQHDDIPEDIFCDPSSCKGEKLCECYTELKVEANQTIQLIWTNVGGKHRADRNHPIHLHGHSFHVLKIGLGKYNKTNGLYLLGQYTDDIDCSGSDACNQPKWKNQNWGGNDIPGMNVSGRPIQKDTLTIPAGGYAVIRFKASNPGKWFMHCHIEFHAMTGMAMVLNEGGTKNHPARPKGFPVCQSYFKDEDLNPVYIKELEAEEQAKYWFKLGVAFASLFGGQSVIVIVFLARRKYKSSGKGASGKETGGKRNEDMELVQKT